MLIDIQNQNEQVKGLNRSLLRDFKLWFWLKCFVFENCLFVNSTIVMCELLKLTRIEPVTCQKLLSCMSSVSKASFSISSGSSSSAPILSSRSLSLSLLRANSSKVFFQGYKFYF